MKTAFLILAVALFSSIATQAQKNYIPLKEFQGDTLKYMIVNFLENKERYIGQKVDSLLNDLEFEIETTFWPNGDIMDGNKIIYANANVENGFLPMPADEKVDIIYLCCPNNPTGTVLKKEDLKKKTMVDHSDDALADELFCDIARYVVENNTASINLLQKKFSCGFSRIQAIIIKLGELGVVSENLGSRAREVLVNSSELEEILENI